MKVISQAIRVIDYENNKNFGKGYYAKNSENI